MSLEMSKVTSDLTTEADYSETELTLGLPGESRGKKRRISDLIALKVINDDDCVSNQSTDTECSDATKPPPAKEQVVGWPPVKLCRKNVVKSSFKYVKVAVDGAPYLRKVDLDSYGCYQQLQCALENVFIGFSNENILNEKRLMDPVNQIEYVTTYEDKDGDWMLVGDVPWTMFIETCKRIRLMRSSKAIHDSSC